MPASPDEPKPRRTCGDWCRFRAAGLGSNARPTCRRPRRRARSADGEPPVHLFGTFARPRHPGAALVHLFASFVRPRHEARGSRAPCRGPHARRRRSLRDGKDLRPAETLNPFLWRPARGTFSDRCHGGLGRGGSLPEACKSPEKVHRAPRRTATEVQKSEKSAQPGRGRWQTRRGASAGRPARCRAPPNGTRPPHGARRHRARSRHPGHASRVVLKTGQSVFAGQKQSAVVLKKGQNVFSGRSLQTPRARSKAASAFLSSAKPQVRRGLSLSSRTGGRDAGPNAAAAAPESDCPTIHFGQFSAHRPLSGCPAIHCARFSAHLPEAARARSSSTFRKTEFLTTCRPGDRSRSRTRARAAPLDVGIFATELRSGRRASAFACARAPAAPPHPPRARRSGPAASETRRRNSRDPHLGPQELLPAGEMRSKKREAGSGNTVDGQKNRFVRVVGSQSGQKFRFVRARAPRFRRSTVLPGTKPQLGGASLQEGAPPATSLPLTKRNF